MDQRKRRKVGVMKEEMIMEEMVILEVLVEIIDTIDLLTQKGIFMHLNVP